MIGAPTDPVKLDSKARFYRGMMCHRELPRQETPEIVAELARERRWAVSTGSLSRLQSCRWTGESYLHELRHSDEFRRHPHRTSIDLQKIVGELFRIGCAIEDLSGERVAVAVA